MAEQKQYFCRYDKNANPNSCAGCEYGCLEKRPATYINRAFEDAVKEMVSND